MAGLQKGALKHVYLLTGEERYYIEKARERLFARLFADQQEATGALQKLTGAITDVCATLTQPIVFLCWGRPALELAEKAVKKSGRSDKFIIASTHPSPLSANNRKSEFPAFIGSRPFSKANEFLKENNAEPIDWAL